jgi:hypothetical protein
MLLIWCITFVIYEFYQLSTMRASFLKDIWNLIEFMRVIFVLIYLSLSLNDDEEAASSYMSFAVFLSWLRVIGYFCLIKKTRYLIRLVFEIMIGIIPFMIIYLTFNLAICYSLMAERGINFIEAWQLAYRLGLADFEEEYSNHESRVFFLIATIVMPLVMLNLLIAIMSDIYARV